MDSIKRAEIIVGALLLILTLVGLPASAQSDFAGEWLDLGHEDIEVDRRGGALYGDYTGLPINEAARMRGETYDASVFSLPEWQCRPHGVDFMPFGASELRVWKEVDPVTQEFTAWRMHWLRSARDRLVYMDDRPHPPEHAPLTWEGFSTAHWEGNMLVIRTTHMKEDYLRRNGISRSSLATLTEFLFVHGDYLTWTVVIDDPPYLDEPLIRNMSYVRLPRQELPAYPCPVVVEEVRPKGFVPHFMPGEHPYLDEYGERIGVPPELLRGGARTLYPEYRLELKELWPEGFEY